MNTNIFKNLDKQFQGNVEEKICLDEKTSIEFLKIYKANYELYDFENEFIYDENEYNQLKVFFLQQGEYIKASIEYGNTKILIQKSINLYFLLNPKGYENPQYLDQISQVYLGYLQQKNYVIEVKREKQLQYIKELLSLNKEKNPNITRFYFMIVKQDPNSENLMKAGYIFYALQRNGKLKKISFPYYVYKKIGKYDQKKIDAKIVHYSNLYLNLKHWLRKDLIKEHKECKVLIFQNYYLKGDRKNHYQQQEDNDDDDDDEQQQEQVQEE